MEKEKNQGSDGRSLLEDESAKAFSKEVERARRDTSDKPRTSQRDDDGDDD